MAWRKRYPRRKISACLLRIGSIGYEIGFFRSGKVNEDDGCCWQHRRPPLVCSKALGCAAVWTRRYIVSLTLRAALPRTGGRLVRLHLLVWIPDSAHFMLSGLAKKGRDQVTPACADVLGMCVTGDRCNFVLCRGSGRRYFRHENLDGAGFDWLSPPCVWPSLLNSTSFSVALSVFDDSVS